MFGAAIPKCRQVDSGAIQGKVALVYIDGNRLSRPRLRVARAKREGRREQSMSRQQHFTIEFDPQVRLLHQAVLLHELNHRISNEFSSAISAVSLAAAHAGNEEAKLALNAVNELLHSYADVHRALRMPETEGSIDAAAYLRRLCGRYA
jgi:two-component sensor histidine kinase